MNAFKFPALAAWRQLHLTVARLILGKGFNCECILGIKYRTYGVYTTAAVAANCHMLSASGAISGFIHVAADVCT